MLFTVFFFSSIRRHTRFSRDWSSDVCSSDLFAAPRDSAFTEITGTTAADLANAIAVRVDAGRDASHAAAGGPVPVTMGGLEYVGKDTTNVSAQSVAVRGGAEEARLRGAATHVLVLCDLQRRRHAQVRLHPHLQ